MSTNPQSLLGKAKKAFQKAVISGLLLTSAVAGLGLAATPAQAQTYNNGVTVTQTMNQQDVKPWAGDPEYREDVSNIMELSRMRMADARSALSQRTTKNFDWLAKKNLEGQKWEAKLRGGKEGYSTSERIRYNTWRVEQLAAFNRTGLDIRNDTRRMEIAEQDKVDAAVHILDVRYSKMPQYASIISQQNRVNAPVVNAPVVVDQGSGVKGVLTPQQMHDNFVKQYQSALLKGQNPDPAKYHLDPNDPAIQIAGPNGTVRSATGPNQQR